MALAWTVRYRAIAAIGLVLALSACGLPRSGPDFGELTDPEQGDLPFDVVQVTPDVTRLTRVEERLGFSVTLIDQPTEATQTIAAGDVMAITVWENIDEGLLNPVGIGATPLPESKVDERGFIFVPYVGLVKAAGRTLNDLREAIRANLAEKTLNPQVDVFPTVQGGRLISMQGLVSAPGLYPIEGATERLLAMLAKAGGVKDDPEVVRIKLRRGRISGEISLQDLYDEPNNDIALKTGDAVIAERDRRIFTALGAVNGPSTVPFPTRDLSVVRALGTVGGLTDQTADPTGVFIFREEPAEIARRLFPGREVSGPTKVAYIIDLTQPAGMFIARDFIMRDNDTLYVTTAPFVKFLKILQAISPVINFAGSARTLSGG